jgi:phosphoribosylaminoimidazole-succinocarboxamide synthase
MMLAADAVFSTDLPLPGRRQGKVRDVYGLPGRTPPALLVVATDRVSAFDVVMPTPMPGKGRLLTQISMGWFRWLREQDLVADHVLSTDVPEPDTRFPGYRITLPPPPGEGDASAP